MAEIIPIKIRCEECGGRLWFTGEPVLYDVDDATVLVECSLCKKEYVLKLE